MAEWIAKAAAQTEERETLKEKTGEPTMVYSDEDIECDLNKKNLAEAKICCLVYGSDGTGKTGISIDFLSKKDVEDGKTIFVIDLDGNASALITSYHSDKIDNIKYINPMTTKETEQGTMVDYVMTFAKIKAVCRYIRKNHEQQKIKAVIFDGLSTLLKYAENQMRLEKHIAADGGVQLIYWKSRNDKFSDVLIQMRSLPIAKFFVAHEDFIVKTDKELSAIKSWVGQIALQKLRCVREDTKDTVVFTTIMDKSKYNVKSEGKVFNFCTVTKRTGEVQWKTEDIFRGMTQ